MKKLMVILFVLFTIGVYSQPNVQPSPSQIGMTYEQITTMYPTYWANPNWWSGKIAYYNAAIPGKVEYYFNQNVCYAIQTYFSSEDSAEVWTAFVAYSDYINTVLHGGSQVSATTGWTYPYYHRWWSCPTGNGAMMFDASRIKYNQPWNDGKLYYGCWISMFSEGLNTPKPINKPNVKL